MNHSYFDYGEKLEGPQFKPYRQDKIAQVPRGVHSPHDWLRTRVHKKGRKG